MGAGIVSSLKKEKRRPKQDEPNAHLQSVIVSRLFKPLV